MRHSFPRFTSAAGTCRWTLFAWIALATGLARGEEGAASGQQLVVQSARRVESEPAISAELRYRVTAYGHTLVGSGAYLQLGTGSDKLIKLTLRMPVGDQFATLTEIRGEDFYWLRKDVPPSAPTLERVNLRDFRQALEQAGATRASDVMPQQNWIALGGLPRLMLALEANFAFEEPRADVLKFSGAEGQPVRELPIWVVSGNWKPEQLAAVSGRPAGAKNLPEQLPDRVELILGRTDEVLPLFPYRITYWQTPGKRSQDKSVGEAPPAPRELLTLELFNVSRKGDIDRREFHYNPGDQEVMDVTVKFIQRWQASAKPR